MIKIEITLGKAYYTQGFFNIRKKYSDLFGDHCSPISIILEERPIDNGYVNRTANNNRTPRIMAGIEMTKWIQENFQENDIMFVEFYVKENKLILNKKKL